MRKFQPSQLVGEQIERFWSYVEQGAKNACWEWRGVVQPNGYGKFSVRINGVRYFVGAHRVALALATYEAPDGLYCLHSCDNRRCCNPGHLRWGTHIENVRDAQKRNRWNIGSRHWKAFLTEEKVREIRAASGPQAEVATRFGIKVSLLKSIRSRRLWKHVV